MLETLSVHEWAEDGIEGSGSYRAAVVDNLPDSYQQFQYKLKPRNIRPILDFLITKGTEDCDSNASAETSGAFAAYFSVAKRGPAAVQIASFADSLPHISPLLIRGSLDGLLRNSTGNLNWRPPGVGGRNSSSPLIPMPPELGIVPGSACRSAQLLPGLVNMPGPLGGVRNSKGSLRSGHASRDSGHYLIDIPNSVEEIMHTGHCRHLLVNLLYFLAGRNLEMYEVQNHDGENRQQVVNLIKYVQSKRRSMIWENEDSTVTRTVLPSASLLSALVESMVDAIFFQGDLHKTWGVEALKWDMECTSRHLACRSHQISCITTKCDE
ncbi:hypothetical protein F3Y22_tig00111005pilonHSYRG00088 [Hibiscus syriacus]|uniref:Cell morphogenesis central region domain-containing protein n=1 Tax=Hibiscus syriacus TaxID=106335 RepID=A0A6A2Z7L7_HIBSY|nr:hypothetical protein F3Y22_tig00111005pilonHSYRG00088 [Hibiscus syriacus]